MELFKSLSSPRGAAGDSPLAPEWSGLLARLAAAHALRREMTHGGPIAAAGIGGSFADLPLSGGAARWRQQGVNLKDSTDRKAPRGKETAIAAHFQPGGREQ